MPARNSVRRAYLSHVACVMPSVEKAARVARSFGFETAEPDLFEGEGTKEIYVGDAETFSSTLLLMEPTKPGSYQNALAKRGAGLHHIAIDVLNLESYVTGCKGWFLLPGSLRTIRDLQTAYLARPGFPALIEVQERGEFFGGEVFITRLELPLLPAQRDLLAVLGVPELGISPDNRFWTTARSRRFSLEELWS